MNSYINFAVGEEVANGAKKAEYNNAYIDVTTGKVNNYESFIYYEGKVDLDETPKAKDFFNKETQFYKAASAVNELMFAYSTDPGALNTYMGYAVSPYKTTFVPEFEAAAQYAIKQGVGTYVVAPSDYGWHIIFVTFKFDGGEVYEGGFVPADVEVDGTFSQLFYDAIESTSVSNYASEKQSVILNAYKGSAKLFERRYKDLLNLD
jgi:parvulin-like peptidyl-prolyl isomerase